MHLVDAFVVDDIVENSWFSSEKVEIFVSNNFLPIRPYAELVSMRRGFCVFNFVYICMYIGFSLTRSHGTVVSERFVFHEVKEETLLHRARRVVLSTIVFSLPRCLPVFNLRSVNYLTSWKVRGWIEVLSC